MAIQYIGFNSNKGNAAGGTSISVNVPSGCQPGDLIYMCVSSDGTGTPSNAPTSTVTPGTWWAEGFADSGRSRVWGHFFESGETSYTWDINTYGTFDSYVIVVVAYRGASQISYQDWNNSSADPPATSKQHTTGNITTGDPNSWWLVFFTSWRADGTKSWTANAGTERLDENETTASVDNASVAAYDSNGPVAVATYNVTGTITTSQDRTLHGHIIELDATEGGGLMMLGVGT